MTKQLPSRNEVLEELAALGISGKDAYFIDFIPLIEMIWADGQAQSGEMAILNEFIAKHVQHLNEMAGYDAFSLDEAEKFVSQFFKQRPSPKILKTLRNFAASYGLYRNGDGEKGPFDGSLLAFCVDIASSSVAKYPYGLHERFDSSEKRCFFEILDAFEGE
jgi:hypothetical protein